MRAVPGCWAVMVDPFVSPERSRTRLTGFDGPPSALWLNDGSRALLGWHGEGGSRFVLFRPGQPTQPIEPQLPGYSDHSPVLWLDSARVLFQTVANGPLSGSPMHCESGWRGDLAVLDLRTGAFTRVTSVPDRIYLRAAGRLPSGILVTEWDSVGMQGHWLYDTEHWQRSQSTFPRAVHSRHSAEPSLSISMRPAIRCKQC